MLRSLYVDIPENCSVILMQRQSHRGGGGGARGVFIRVFPCLCKEPNAETAAYVENAQGMDVVDSVAEVCIDDSLIRFDLE